MNKRTQILKQITSEKLPNLIEYQPTSIKSSSAEPMAEPMAAPMLEEHQTLLSDHIFTIADTDTLT